MMKKILILDTSIGTLNMGDEIINRSILLNWEELYTGNYVCRYPTHTPPHSWWQQLFWGRKLRMYDDVDYKFLCGTNALYTNMLRPTPAWNIHIHNASLLKGTILLGVGAGVNSTGMNYYTRKLFDRVLSHDYIHSVRDEATKELLEKIGFKAYNTGCPTIWGLTPEFCTQIPYQKSNSVVFTLTGYHADKANDRKMVEILIKLYEKVYFWPQTISDLDYLESLGVVGYTVVPPNLISYDKLLCSDIDYVGNRLHGGIRALQHHRRSLIISIDYRAVNMAQCFSLPVIPREAIPDCLESWILSKQKIGITGIDFDLINKWKSQFNLQQHNMLDISTLQIGGGKQKRLVSLVKRFAA